MLRKASIPFLATWRTHEVNVVKLVRQSSVRVSRPRDATYTSPFADSGEPAREKCVVSVLAAWMQAPMFEIARGPEDKSAFHSTRKTSVSCNSRITLSIPAVSEILAVMLRKGNWDLKISERSVQSDMSDRGKWRV